MGEAFRPALHSETFETVQQGCLADILGFPFNAQTFNLAQRIRGHQGRRTISGRDDIRDVQFDAEVIHVLLGFLDLFLLLRETFFQGLDPVIAQILALLEPVGLIGLSNGIGNLGGFIGLLTEDANLNKTGVAHGAEVDSHL